MCWSTGREPIAQPPGNETSASPKRATSGPSTRIEARMVRTRSYGATWLSMVRGSTCIFMRSSSTRLTPMRPSSSMKVVTSCRCGTLLIVTGPSASRQAARIGSTAFLAPEMATSPWSGSPPLIRILAMNVLRGMQKAGAVSTARRGFLGSQRLQRQRMDRPAHQFAQRAVHHAVARQWQLAGELAGHHGGFEVHAVVAADLRGRAGQAGFDQCLDAGRVHRRVHRWRAAAWNSQRLMNPVRGHMTLKCGYAMVMEIPWRRNANGFPLSHEIP